MSGKFCIPEMTLGSDGQVLKHKPDANSIIRIRQAERTRSKTTNQVAGEHALRLLLVVGRSELLHLLAIVRALWLLRTSVALCVDLSSCDGCGAVDSLGRPLVLRRLALVAALGRVLRVTPRLVCRLILSRMLRRRLGIWIDLRRPTGWVGIVRLLLALAALVRETLWRQ